MVTPPSSTSRVAVRAMFLMGDTQRSISSTAPGMRPSGSAASAASWSGWASSSSMPAADHVARRLVAADEDEERLVDERVVVERVAVDLGVAQHADQVVGAAARPALVEDRV